MTEDTERAPEASVEVEVEVETVEPPPRRSEVKHTSRPRTRTLHRFVGTRRAGDKTQRLSGPWGTAVRDGDPVAISEADLRQLEAMGYLFTSERR